MARKKSKLFRIQRRYAVFAETEIEAETFDDAVEVAKALTFDQFLKPADSVTLIHDFDRLPGDGIQEEF